MKRFIMIMLVAVMVLTMFACGKEVTNSESSFPNKPITEKKPVDIGTSNNSNIDNPTSDTVPSDEQDGIGGDSLRWTDYKYSDKFTSIVSPWGDYIFEQTGKRVLEWWDTGEWYTDDGAAFALIDIIYELDISKEMFIELNNKHIEDHREVISSYSSLTEEDAFCIHCFTDEEIDIIYSGDKRRIAEAFALPYAVVADNWELYPLRWIIDNPATLYKEREISLEAIQKSVDKIIEDGLVLNADKEALLARIEEYKKLL